MIGVGFVMFVGRRAEKGKNDGSVQNVFQGVMIFVSLVSQVGSNVKMGMLSVERCIVMEVISTVGVVISVKKTSHVVLSGGGVGHVNMISVLRVSHLDLCVLLLILSKSQPTTKGNLVRIGPATFAKRLNLLLPRDGFVFPVSTMSVLLVSQVLGTGVSKLVVM